MTTTEHTEALRWNEGWTFAAAEYRSLAAALEKNDGEVEAPRDGEGDCTIEVYWENIFDTLHECGIPYGAFEPLFVRLAMDAYHRAASVGHLAREVSR